MLRTSTTIASYLALAIAILFFAGPLLWLVLASFKSPEELKADPYALFPREWRWENYRDAVAAMPLARYLANTLVLCVGSVAGTILSCSLAAYAFARLRWPGRDWAFGIVIATLLLPWHVTVIPKFLLLREAGLYNTPWAIIAPTFLGNAFYIFLLRQYFLAVPEELCEAGRLDGLSEWGVYSQIVMPLNLPALVTVGLFQFVATWNDFQNPLLLLSDPETFPLAYGLEQFLSAYSDQTHLLLAAAVLFSIPVLGLFLITQQAFVEGANTDGLKG